MKRFLAASVAAVTILFASGAFAQEQPAPDLGLPQGEVTQEQLDLGAELLALSGSSTAFDEVLPNVADRVKSSLIRSNPQMQLGIIETVDQVALQMVDKRGDLDRALARLWATAFTVEELEELIAFYQTETGKKFANLQPRIITAQIAVAERWGQALAGEINKEVTAQLKEQTASEAGELLGGTPATGGAGQ